MKPLLVVCALLLALVVGAAAAQWYQSPTTARPGEAAATAADLAELRAALTALEQRLAALERAPAFATAERADAFALPPQVAAPAGSSERHDPLWYLEQYVRSFADDAQGSEYFRLAVDAYAVELAAPIAALVREARRPIALRIALVDMLGKRRFGELPFVVDALLAALPPPATEALALHALAALEHLESPVVLPGLEGVLPSLVEPAVRERALALLVALAGDGANAALLRLFGRGPDDALRSMLIRRLSGDELVAALELLRAASGGDQPVRLTAAQKVGEYDEPDFDAFVAQWLAVERDPQVVAALGGRAAAQTAPGWSARKAIGPPDADPLRDDPNAWAPRSPQMGLQWLQLSYATPAPANAVRIHEVNASGAVAELRARGPDGAWVTLWRGTADGAGAPLEIRFPLTAFAVRTIRIVLDTDRRPGWNEIDAVELLGPGGGQWAARAAASSTFASASASAEAVGASALGERAFRTR